MTEEQWHERLSEHAYAHGRRYYAIALRILGDASSAEDAAQSAFTKAWQQRNHLRDADRLGAWLRRVVVNESLQRIRRRKLETAALTRHAVQAASQEPGTETLEQREVVMHALSQLEEPTRTVVILRVMRGLSGNEVKDLLGCSASEVSRRLHAGMDELRSIVREAWI